MKRLWFAFAGAALGAGVILGNLSLSRATDSLHLPSTPPPAPPPTHAGPTPPATLGFRECPEPAATVAAAARPSLGFQETAAPAAAVTPVAYTEQQTLSAPRYASTLPPAKTLPYATPQPVWKATVNQLPQTFETPPPPTIVMPAQIEPTYVAAPAVDFAPAPSRPSRIWGSAEYMLWRVEDAPLPGALLIDHNQPTATVGTVPPGSKVLFGGTDVDYDPVSGGRATVGFSLNTAYSLGLEISGFMLDEAETNYFRSTQKGSPLIGLPMTINGVPSTIPLSYTSFGGGNPIDGSFAARASSWLWGGEFNAVIRPIQGPAGYVEFLIGFRYCELNEELDLAYTERFLPGDGVPFTSNVRDNFDTRNQFFGGQVGVRGALRLDRVALEWSAKVALGTTYQVVNVGGSTTINSNQGFTPFLPFGVYAAQDNSGRRSANDFAAISEGQIKASFFLTPYLRAFVGFDAMYWSSVARPGNQLDRDATSTVGAGGVTMTLANYLNFIGPGVNGRNGPRLDTSGFWAHGVSFGMELRF